MLCTSPTRAELPPALESHTVAPVDERRVAEALAVPTKVPPALVHVDVPKKLCDQVASPAAAGPPAPPPPAPPLGRVEPSPQFWSRRCIQTVAAMSDVSLYSRSCTRVMVEPTGITLATSKPSRERIDCWMP